MFCNCTIDRLDSNALLWIKLASKFRKFLVRHLVASKEIILASGKLFRKRLESRILEDNPIRCKLEKFFVGTFIGHNGKIRVVNWCKEGKSLISEQTKASSFATEQ